MNLKQQITSKFDKSIWKDIKLDDYDCIDKYIRDFIIEINKYNNITTSYSCEGHKESDRAYLYFKVDNDGWVIFWNTILPELSYLLNGIFDLSVMDNPYSSGINIGCILKTNEFYNWEELKVLFWKQIIETFNKYYK